MCNSPQSNAFVVWVFTCLLNVTAVVGIAQVPVPKPPSFKPESKLAALPEQSRRGPIASVNEILFCTRAKYDDSHWYANIGYYCDDEKRPAYAGNGKPDVGRLLLLNLDTGMTRVLFDAMGGSVRDPDIHWDAQKLVFAWRKNGEPNYHLYELPLAGGEPRQLTSGPFDDYEPCYLPDDSIAFVSTRCKRWVNCWMTQVGILYRCDPDGGNQRAISANTEQDNTPAVLNDGRLIYTRWEYVDRSQVGYHVLWTMLPDGTGPNVFFGNQEHYPLYIDPRPIPGSTTIACIESPGHGRNEHRGYVALLSMRGGPDDKQSLKRLTQKPDYVDPFPLSEDCVVAARGKEIVLLDGSGAEQVLHRNEEPCHEPRPVIRRQRPPSFPLRAGEGGRTGRFALMNVYEGRNLTGVAKGDIRRLLVIESLPKPVNFSGGPDLLSWLGTFTLERALGTVPVEEDGSAYFEAPANRQLFFVALDARNRSVKRMQSFTAVRPGETLGCVGCHEFRTMTAPNRGRTALALRRPASVIEPVPDVPSLLDYHRDIQPIFDRHCVKCHNFADYKGHLSLEGDLGSMWGHAYFALFARLQIADGRNGLGNQSPRTIGTSASSLMEKIGGGHHDAKPSTKEQRVIWTWIECAAPYVGTYAALRNEAEMKLGGWSDHVFRECRAVISNRCASCHDGQKVSRVPYCAPEWPDKRGIERSVARYERLVITNDPLARFSSPIVVNMSRPEQSPLIKAPLARSDGGWETCGAVFASKDDPDYRQMLDALQHSKVERDKIPRYSTPEWRANRQYIREMKRFGILPPSFDPATNRLDTFETDSAYWDRLWKESLGLEPVAEMKP